MFHSGGAFVHRPGLGRLCLCGPSALVGTCAVVALADWEPWALLTPAVVLLSQRFRFSRASWRGPLAIHLPAGLIIGGTKLAIEAVLTRAILGYGCTPFSFLKIYLTLLTYWAIVAVTHVARRYRDARERELRSSQLETALAHAQVEALKMQLHPHFLFNTLNTIAGLMREDVEAADRMLASWPSSCDGPSKWLTSRRYRSSASWSFSTRT